jgi:hypothetical protein
MVLNIHCKKTWVPSPDHVLQVLVWFLASFNAAINYLIEG